VLLKGYKKRKLRHSKIKMLISKFNCKLKSVSQKIRKKNKKIYYNPKRYLKRQVTIKMKF
jgi:hypothetical protein